VYVNHWKRWSQWFVGAGVDSLSLTAIDIANHLILKSSKGLAAATLRVRRSAISSTLSMLQAPDFSLERLVADVLKGAAQAQPLRFPVGSVGVFFCGKVLSNLYLLLLLKI
jgi:hypothetical protein